MGAKGFSVNSVASLKPAIQAWLATSGIAVLDVRVDPEEEAATPDKEVARRPARPTTFYSGEAS